MSKQKFIMEPYGNEEYKKPRFNGPMIAVLDAKETDNQEWAVYYGLESEGADEIKKHGYKAPEELARFLFPNISGHYRK